MTSQTIKWGVLGYARIAKNSLIPAIQEAPNSELYAVASRDPEKLKECRELFACPKLYEDYDAMLEDPELQAVYIPLPNSMHKEWAIKAMRKGKHVLCEKPIALNAAECREMIEAAEQSGVLLMEAFMYRFTELALRVKEIIGSGELGELKYIHSTFRFLLDRPNTIKVRPELGGGSLYDVGCYPVSFVNMITGRAPVSCVSQSVLEGGVDVIFSALMKYEDGLIAAVNSGFNAQKDTRTEIIGTKGKLEVPDTFSGMDGAITVITDTGAREVPVRDTGRYTLEVTDFAEAILQKRPPGMSLEDSLLNMQVLDMLFASMNAAR
jgi:D-xylose 1-dehydrogenase (NADP+, D-xylono-1,5-lactone-forming)